MLHRASEFSGVLWTQEWNFRFRIKRGISWLV